SARTAARRWVLGMRRRRTVRTLSPYTTLFRSDFVLSGTTKSSSTANFIPNPSQSGQAPNGALKENSLGSINAPFGACPDCDGLRSEEHTSELQARFEAGCRLLLE